VAADPPASLPQVPLAWAELQPLAVLPLPQAQKGSRERKEPLA
jgi:hypothetical protein